MLMVWLIDLYVLISLLSIVTTTVAPNCITIVIPYYSWKSWRRTKFGGLVVCLQSFTTTKLKMYQNFLLTCIIICTLYLTTKYLQSFGTQPPNSIPTNTPAIIWYQWQGLINPCIWYQKHSYWGVKEMSHKVSWISRVVCR